MKRLVMVLMLCGIAASVLTAQEAVKTNQGPALVPAGEPVKPEPEVKAPVAPEFSKIQLYGYVSLYGWYNTAAFVGHDLVIRTLAEDKTAFGMSGKSTRLGLKLSFPGIEAVNLSGMIEIDFSGDYAASGSAENQPMPRLRHAFLNVNNGGKETVYGVIAGSTWTVVSPLFPTLINPGAGWAMGNLWNRLPQVQFYLDTQFGGAADKLGFKLAAARAMTGSSTYRSVQVTPNIDGGDATGIPQFQAEAHLNTKLADDVSLFLSVSGVFGSEDYTAAFPALTNTAASIGVSGIAASLRLALGSLSLSGEFFTGSNLDVLGAQFGQAILPDYSAAFSTMGFWGELGFKLSPEWAFQAGYGMEDPEDDTAARASYYNKNSALWLSGSWQALKNLSLAVSLIQLTTVYGNGSELSGLSLMFESKLLF